MLPAKIVYLTKQSNNIVQLKTTNSFKKEKNLTLWRPAGFGNFWKKTHKHTWLSMGISLVRYALQTC